MRSQHFQTLACFVLLSTIGSMPASAAEKARTSEAQPPPAADDTASPTAKDNGAGEPQSAPATDSAKQPGDSNKKSDADDTTTGDGDAHRLPGGIHLSGMFDVAYERADRSADLTSGKNTLRNYHHLLFLSRQGDDVPIGFNAEVLSQYFFELNARLSQPGSRLRVLAHVGKILVPFGPDPLFHKSYGGLTGVDQRTLPVVWSAIGAGVRFSYATGGLSVSDEVYAVQGFDLPSPSQTLNMQRDLAAYDGARIAFGNRLGLAAGPVTLWHSFYWNQMRFGRLLIMQAVDLALWRPRLPVLNRLALGAGFVRAHVSATDQYGRPGASPDESAYYHFADYVWLRLYATDGLYLQARSGLATFDNRTGLTYDQARADRSDASHHSLALVLEHASAQVMLSYHWNFEKIDERSDDFLRLMVTYAF
jgi:hypothetical protein